MKLSIKTISEKIEYADSFDEKVNEYLSDGWDITDRQVIASGGDVLLLAQLSRYEDDDEEDYDDNSAEWLTTRDPLHPYRCSHCGYVLNIESHGTFPHTCPQCESIML